LGSETNANQVAWGLDLAIQAERLAVTI